MTSSDQGPMNERLSNGETSPDRVQRHPSDASSLLPAWVNPDLDRLLTVHRKTDGSYYRSWTESKVDLPAGSIFARISGITATSKQDHATIQAGLDLHIILNSDLYFMNHSCDPSLECDMSTFEVKVSRDRDLKKGDTLSFFYPSTEWTMAREFECWCGAAEGKCCKKISGAEDMNPKDLKRYWLNTFIIHQLQALEK